VDPLTGSNLHLTDPDAARRFVAATGIDALAVYVGQMHLHGRRLLWLDLDRLRELAALPVARHIDSTGRCPGGDWDRGPSRLEQAFLSALQEACRVVPDGVNPYLAIGSGIDGDMLLPGRRAMAAEVAARIADAAFSSLRAPIRRVAGPDTPIPCGPALERAWLPDIDRITATAVDLCRKGNRG
jgi:Fructose-bisphosphate aldolase class-II/Transketolase, C-terminal domain